jgi:hypothetical protein
MNNMTCIRIIPRIQAAGQINLQLTPKKRPAGHITERSNARLIKMSSRQPQIPTAIERALSRFNDTHAKKEDIFSQSTTVVEIWTLAKALEEEQGGRMSLRNMRRIEPFITGVLQYAKVIEVFVQVKPEILGLIWVRLDIDRY